MFNIQFFRIPEQLKNYLAYCKLANSIANSCLDLKKLDYIYPTTLLPLLMKHPCNELTISPDNDCARYLKYMANSKENPAPNNASYFPPISLPKDKAKYDTIMHYLYKFHSDGKEYGGSNAFKLAIGELTDNIYQHSAFEKAMVFAQKYSKKKFVEICIMDNGVGIPTALKNFGLIFDSDSKAIYYATKGLSSKEEIDRGRGIKSCISVYCGQTNAQMLIISGTGAFFINKSLKPNLYKFPDNYILKGTLINFRIPYPCKDVDIYEGGILENGVY